MADRGRAEREAARRATKAQLRSGALERQQDGQRRHRAQRANAGPPKGESCSSEVRKSLLVCALSSARLANVQNSSSQDTLTLAIFEPLGPNRWQPTALAAGPFASLQGGAVASLLTAEVEALAAMRKWGTAISSSTWFLRPTPMTVLRTGPSVVIKGGRVSVIDNTLWPDGEDQALRHRAGDVVAGTRGRSARMRRGLDAQ